MRKSHETPVGSLASRHNTEPTKKQLGLQGSRSKPLTLQLPLKNSHSFSYLHPWNSTESEDSDFGVFWKLSSSVLFWIQIWFRTPPSVVDSDMKVGYSCLNNVFLQVLTTSHLGKYIIPNIPNYFHYLKKYMWYMTQFRCVGLYMRWPHQSPCILTGNSHFISLAYI